MGIQEFFRTIQWRATLQVAAIRVIIASLLWPTVFIIFGSVQASDFLPTMVALLLSLTVFLAVAIPVVGLARAGVPYIGLLALPAWLIVIADPIVMILHNQKPEWVPVDTFKLFNAPVLAVFRSDEEEGAVLPPEY